jgi:hypothetical protein
MIAGQTLQEAEILIREELNRKDAHLAKKKKKKKKVKEEKSKQKKEEQSDTQEKTASPKRR